MNTFRLDIMTPYGNHPGRDIASLMVPATDGLLTILAHHQPMICAVREGTTVIRAPDGAEEQWNTAQGTLTVTRENATLLVRFAIPPAPES